MEGAAQADQADGLAGAAGAEAGPSKTAPAKRKYEVDVKDREFCKKVSWLFRPASSC